MKRTAWMAVFLGLVSASAMAAESLGNFSADVVTSTPEGVMAMKLYASGDKSRMEMPESVIIIRRDLGVMWMVMPGQGMYMEQPIDLQMAAQSSPDVQGEIERTSMGRETIDGRSTEKFKVSYEAQGQRGQIYQWLDGQMPVRTQAVDGSWTVDFKNIQTGSQPASLFEPPAGFEKMAIPSMDALMQRA